MRHRPSLALAGLLALSIPAVADEILLEVPSDNRAYVIDLDSRKVQEWLVPVKHRTSSFPAWLAPYPGATPRKVEVSGDRTRAEFISSGTVQQVMDRYDELLRSEGYSTTPRMKGPQTGSIFAMVSGDIIRGGVYLHKGQLNVGITRTLSGRKGRTGRRRLREQWYEESRGFLHINDLDTGEQFYLRKEAFPRVASKSWALK